MIEGILIILIIIGLLINTMKRPKKYPPGPIPLPIVGSFHILDHQHPMSSLEIFHKRYGSHTGLLMGGFRVIIVSGYEAVTEALANDDLLGRPDVCLIRDRFDGDKFGLLFTDGDEWKTQRRFTLHHFRNFGFGKRNHEMIIQEEAEKLIETIKDMNGKPFCLEKQLSMPFINIVWSLMGNSRLCRSDDDLRILSTSIKDSIHSIKFFGSIAVGFPFLRFLFPQTTGYTGVVRGSKGLQEFLQKVIDEHKATREKNDPRDLIDAYLDELEKADLDSSFSEQQLIGLCMDLLCAGGDTSTNAICFCILFLCYRKDLQEKIYQEVQEHVGPSRMASSSDRPKLVWTEALLMEVLRMRTPSPTTIPHRALKDTSLGGYNVPMDTIVIINLMSVFMDPEYWGDPENFRPERYISSDGKLLKKDRLFPFGKGKRMCVGESLAKLSTFILLASLVQKFTFSFDQDLPAPQTEGVPGFTLAAPVYQIVATQRECVTQE